MEGEGEGAAAALFRLKRKRAKEGEERAFALAPISVIVVVAAASSVRPRPSHGALARSFPVGNPVAVALSGRPPHRGLAAQNGKRKWSWEADTGSRGPVRQDIRSSGGAHCHCPNSSRLGYANCVSDTMKFVPCLSLSNEKRLWPSRNRLIFPVEKGQK